MALPESRNVTLVASDPVPSDLLNDLQDCVVEGKHGTKTLVLHVAMGLPRDSSDTLAGWNFAMSNGVIADLWSAPASGESVVFPIPLHIGDRILAVRGRIQDTAGGHTINMRIHKSDADGADLTNASSSVGTTQTSAGTGAVQTLTVSGLTEVIASFISYQVNFTANDGTTTTHRVACVEIDYDHP